MRRVHVELHRQSLGDEVLLGERARQFDPVGVGQLGVRRQRQHDLAGDLRVFPPLGRLRRVPQHRAVGEPPAAPSGSSTSWCSGASRWLK